MGSILSKIMGRRNKDEADTGGEMDAGEIQRRRSPRRQHPISRDVHHVVESSISRSRASKIHVTENSPATVKKRLRFEDTPESNNNLRSGRPVSSTPIYSQNLVPFTITQSPVKINSKLKNVEMSPGRSRTLRSNRLQRISETPSLSPSKSLINQVGYRGETSTSKQSFAKRLRSTGLDSSRSSSRSCSPKKRRRGITESPPSRKSPTKRARAKTVSPTSEKSHYVKNSVKQNNNGNPRESSVNDRNESSEGCIGSTDQTLHNVEESILTPSPIAVSRTRGQRMADEHEQQESGLLASKNSEAAWILISIFSTTLGEELDITSSTLNRKGITKLFLKYVDRSWTIPSQINLGHLDFFAGQVIKVDQSINEGTLMLLKRLAVSEDHGKRNDVWKVVLAGKVSPCLRFSAKLGNTLLIYGCTLNTASKLINIDSENLSQDCFIYNYCKNGKDRPDSEKNYMESTSIYWSSDTVTYFPLFDDINSCSVVITYPRQVPDLTNYNRDENQAGKEPSSDNRNVIQLEDEENGSSNERMLLRENQNTSRSTRMLSEENINPKEKTTGDELLNDRTQVPHENPGPSNVRMSETRDRQKCNKHVIQSSRDNVNQNDVESDTTGTPVFRRTQALSDNEDVELPPILTEPEINEMTYDDWIRRGSFVHGEQRPKVRKARHDEAYVYKLLKTLDDELSLSVKSEGMTGQNPLMMLSSQQFTYGIVSEIVPPRYGFPNSYIVRIWDESMKDVLLRLCNSEMEQRRGPEIEKGQVIRVHRMTVQVERDPFFKTQRMVLSTSPHTNYTLFNYEEGSRNIVYTSMAKSISLTKNDEKRVFELLTLRDKRAQEPPEMGTAANDDDIDDAYGTILEQTESSSELETGNENDTMEFLATADKLLDNPEMITGSQEEILLRSNESNNESEIVEFSGPRNSRRSPRFHSSPPPGSPV